MQKTIVEKHFDKVSGSYDIGKKRYSLYYQNLKRLLSELIPLKSNVLEIGCGTGDLLVSLKPKKGYGFDLSHKMINIANRKYSKLKELNFSYTYPSNFFDYIFMSDVVEHLQNRAEEFKKVSNLMKKDSKFILTMANPRWEPLLIFWEKVGWKMPEGPHERVSCKILSREIEAVDMKIIHHNYKLLMPIQIPIITSFVNRYLERYFRNFAFIEYLVAVKV